MSLSLILSIITLALLDSLNPSLFAAQFYLLNSPKPSLRTFFYILGILFVMLFGGILILSGLKSLLENYIASIDKLILLSIQACIGIVFLVLGFYFPLHPKTKPEAKKPSTSKLIHAFFLGIVVMLNEITTALPYFVALEQIAQAQLNLSENALILLLYQLFFSLPLFGFLFAYLALRERLRHWTERVQAWIEKWTPYLLKYACIAFGAFLLLGAALA
jgi:cytochrome c biogenesis protein CcdA